MPQMDARRSNALLPLPLHLWDISCLNSNEIKCVSTRNTKHLSLQQFVKDIVFNYLCVLSMAEKEGNSRLFNTKVLCVM